MKHRSTASLLCVGSMLIFGTVGLCRRLIPLPSATVAALRGICGAVFILAFLLFRGKKPDMAGIRKSLVPLLVSGAVMGINWVLLFESYSYTTVAAATLLYYMAPVFITIVSAFLLKERLTPLRIVCILAAVAGMVLISGILGGDGAAFSLPGTLLALGAAALYATVVLINKRMPAMDPFSRTATQLLVAGVVVLPYALIVEHPAFTCLTGAGIAALAVICLVHTGIAYLMYFGSMEALPAMSLAVFSYVDPVTAVLLSALLLGEPLGITGIIGTVLILGSALVSELVPARRA